MYVGNFGHRRNGKHQLILLLFKCYVNVAFFLGTIHGNARSLHEERPGLCAGVLDHGTIHVQRPAGPPRADFKG